MYVYLRSFVKDIKIKSRVIRLQSKQIKRKKRARNQQVHKRPNGALSCTHNTKVLMNRLTYDLRTHYYYIGNRNTHSHYYTPVIIVLNIEKHDVPINAINQRILVWLM